MKVHFAKQKNREILILYEKYKCFSLKLIYLMTQVFFNLVFFFYSWPVLYKIQSSIIARTSPKVLRHYYVLPTCSGVGELTWLVKSGMGGDLRLRQLGSKLHCLKICIPRFIDRWCSKFVILIWHKSSVVIKFKTRTWQKKEIGNDWLNMYYVCTFNLMLYI